MMDDQGNEPAPLLLIAIGVLPVFGFIAWMLYG